MASTFTAKSNRIDTRIENIVAGARMFGYHVEIDEWSDILNTRTIVIRQARKWDARDTELRIEVHTDEAYGVRRVTCRGWHHLDRTNRGKAVPFSSAAMWLQRHAAS